MIPSRTRIESRSTPVRLLLNFASVFSLSHLLDDEIMRDSSWLYLSKISYLVDNVDCVVRDLYIVSLNIRGMNLGRNYTLYQAFC